MWIAAVAAWERGHGHGRGRRCGRGQRWQTHGEVSPKPGKTQNVALSMRKMTQNVFCSELQQNPSTQLSPSLIRLGTNSCRRIPWVLRKTYFWLHFPHGHGPILCLVQLGRDRDMGKKRDLMAGNCAFLQYSHPPQRVAPCTGGVSCRRPGNGRRGVSKKLGDGRAGGASRRGAGWAWHVVGVCGG